jgi:pimeloyl-ACP methyl ester carboxylesterase
MRSHEELRVVADDGVGLQVARWHRAQGSAGPTVLGLHGLTANRFSFLPLLEHLDPQVELVTLDHRGRGLSDKPTAAADYGHRRNAEDAATVLRALGLSEVIVVGQSMGSWVGLELAAHHPDLVSHVVLVDGGYFPDLPVGVTPSEYVDSIMGPGWAARLGATVPSVEAMLQGFQLHPAFSGIWSAGLEEHLRQGMEVLPDGTARAWCTRVAAVTDSLDYFTPAGHVPYVRADLALVSCPVTLLRAEAGFSISPETMAPMMSTANCEEFVQALPGLRVETVPGTNHYSIGYGPAGVARLAELLAELSSTARS